MNSGPRHATPPRRGRRLPVWLALSALVPLFSMWPAYAQAVLVLLVPIEKSQNECGFDAEQIASFAIYKASTNNRPVFLLDDYHGEKSANNEVMMMEIIVQTVRADGDPIVCSAAISSAFVVGASAHESYFSTPHFSLATIPIGSSDFFAYAVQKHITDYLDGALEDRRNSKSQLSGER